MPRGRPPKAAEDRAHPLQLRVYSADRERLERLAERDNETASEVVRRALVLYEQATSEGEG